MATFSFIRVDEESEKAIKIIVRESGYDMEKLQVINQKYFWIPKSVIVEMTSTSIEVKDWFYDKNIAVDTYSAFMKAMSNN